MLRNPRGDAWKFIFFYFLFLNPITVHGLLHTALEQQPKFWGFPFVSSTNPTIPSLHWNPMIPIISQRPNPKSYNPKLPKCYQICFRSFKSDFALFLLVLCQFFLKILEYVYFHSCHILIGFSLDIQCSKTRTKDQIVPIK